MNVSPRTTIEQLQQEVADRYGFPPKVQKWIIAKKLATPSDTLSSLNVKHAGSTAYLYLVSGQSVGLKREEFEHFVSRSEERRHAGVFMSMEVNSTQAPVPTMAVGPGAAISRTSSLPHVNSTRPLSASSAELRTQREVELLNVAGNPVVGESNLNGLPLVGGTNSIGLPVANELHQQIGISVQQGSNFGQTVGNPVVEQSPGGGIHSAQSIQDIQQALRGEEQAVLTQSVLRGEEQAVPPASIADIQRAIRGDQPQARLAQEETEIPSQGWTCPSCTLVNSPTRPGCEICSTERPANYVVPQNPRITEQERRRLEREREETELLQRTLDRQQQEQEQAREVNFRQLVQTAQQNLIRNTEEFDCAICFLTVPPGEGVVLRECLHCFCQDCLREHIRNCTDPEVQCPFQDNDFACHFVITAQEIKALLPEEDFNKFLNRSLATAESQAANSFHCKTPNCPGWCIYEDNSNIFHCPVCQKVNCLTCKAIHHPEMNCKEYQEDLQRRAQNDSAAKQTQKYLEQMIAKGDAMKCPQCAIILLKKDGCDWMRCSMCRLEICWATRGPRWGPQGVGDLSGGCKCRVGGKRCHPNCKNCH